MTIRAAAADLVDIGQAREWLAARVRHEHPADERALALRGLTLPPLPRSPGRDEIWAVATVRDEADVVRAAIDHLLSQGVDHVLVCDHRSADGTRELLRELERSDGRIHLAVDDGEAHLQHHKITALARRAWWAGASWVVPFDADEWWFAETGSLGDALRASRAGVLTAAMHDALPAVAPFARLDPVPAGDHKVAFRAHPLVNVGPGNHGVDRRGRVTGGLRIAHVPYRDSSQVARKFANGSRALDAAGAREWEGWHWRAGAALARDDADAMWRAMEAGQAVPAVGWEPSGRWVDVSMSSASWPLTAPPVTR
ncbi:glycosyltransferase family 2 protein [Demequina sp. NBRC 110053]|uniref:glycosyltransferase family 2 protein n=1 Tax=Demequina sp. NBRC 110053 TaxID=1570342 RepID=UPI001186E7F6|nr:glycosyltransferase family 2 protein [Demequina sp. NBRC 110053]